MKKFKYNIANGFWLPMIFTSIFIAAEGLRSPSVSVAGTIVGMGAIAAWLAAILFNIGQAALTDNHEMRQNEFYEAMATGAGALLVGGPVSYALYLWWGDTYWQLVPGLLLGAVVFYSRKYNL